MACFLGNVLGSMASTAADADRPSTPCHSRCADTCADHPKHLQMAQRCCSAEKMEQPFPW
eukprot:CAMPEP_0172694916 /NCGR_PEP_ID=MMETSP1074-20121228/26995_1 /TAXON_ID=2916 /ORGANISM="Ceratium fusus, Strain PA161109" /LENGTH=59 /DNA_ID=CAMNT_0013515469 /DNA_START=155 /DNA_END=331 /DNA_ORIENTATION=+